MSIYRYPLQESTPRSLHTYLGGLQSMIEGHQDDVIPRIANVMHFREGTLLEHIPYRQLGEVTYYDLSALFSIHVGEETGIGNVLGRIISFAAGRDQLHRLQRNWHFGPSLDNGSDNITLYPFMALKDFDTDCLPLLKASMDLLLEYPESVCTIIRALHLYLKCSMVNPSTLHDAISLPIVESSDEPRALCASKFEYDLERQHHEPYNIWYVQSGNRRCRLSYHVDNNGQPWYPILGLFTIFSDDDSDVLPLYDTLSSCLAKVASLRLSQHDPRGKHHFVQLSSFFDQVLPALDSHLASSIVSHRRLSAAAAAGEASHPISLLIHPPENEPSQPLTESTVLNERFPNTDTERYRAELHNARDIKCKVLELASAERIRALELETEQTMELQKLENERVLADHAFKIKIEEVRTEKERAKAEQEKHKTSRKQVEKDSNVRRWELEAEVELTRLKYTGGRINVNGRTIKNSTSTTSRKKMPYVDVPYTRSYRKPVYNKRYNHPRRGIDN